MRAGATVRLGLAVFSSSESLPSQYIFYLYPPVVFFGQTHSLICFLFSYQLLSLICITTVNHPCLHMQTTSSRYPLAPRQYHYRTEHTVVGREEHLPYKTTIQDGSRKDGMDRWDRTAQAWSLLSDDVFCFCFSFPLYGLCSFPLFHQSSFHGD